jgi:hypothetical protein
MVSRLLFTDDCLLFTEASERGGQRRMKILHSYQQGLGQMVNMAKLVIFFGAICDDQLTEEMKMST